eukprot:TRINITY_DN75232_c0_g1_i1.p1 TRINITY_DN75232_c0_g1~~TRINITY_DN75232_c0_g1_i1.p1  ORF type:complete len:380 (-),score=73.05 TRINITY_DN75232_c0_g1_i1:90-1229(-)
MPIQRRTLKVAIVQLAPEHKNPEVSRQKADELIERALASVGPEDACQIDGDLDVLVLPELCFSGYTFQDSNDVAPFLEFQDEGPTYSWCLEKATRFNCYVVCSFPEKVRPPAREQPSMTVAHLAQIVIAPSGGIVACHRKHALWGPDVNCFTPGKDVGTAADIVLKTGQTVKVGLGICLDMLCYWNSKLEQSQIMNAEARRPEQRLADFWKQAGVDVVLFSTAEPLYDDVDYREYLQDAYGIDPFAEGNEGRQRYEKEILQNPAVFEKDYLAGNRTLEEYILCKEWLEPVEPLFTSSEAEAEDSLKPVVFVCASRTGWERIFDGEKQLLSQCHFAGCSSVYAFNVGGVRKDARMVRENVELLGKLGIVDEQVLVAEVHF